MKLFSNLWGNDFYLNLILTGWVIVAAVKDQIVYFCDLTAIHPPDERIKT
jgi:hypothetical protein